MDVSYLVEKDHVKCLRDIEDNKENITTRIVKWLCSVFFFLFSFFFFFIYYGAAVER